jgi:hypothetical protein
MESFPANRRMGTILMPGNTIGDLHPILRDVKASPLFALRLASRPQPIGATPGCVRRIFAVTGGVFEGARLSGQVLDSGNDWQTVRGDGAVTLDVRLVLKTSDDAMIGMAYRGIRHGAPEVLAWLDCGEKVDPASYYFRISAVFETATPKYEWLNRLLAVGVGHRRPDGPIYNLFELL